MLRIPEDQAEFELAVVVSVVGRLTGGMGHLSGRTRRARQGGSAPANFAVTWVLWW